MADEAAPSQAQVQKSFHTQFHGEKRGTSTMPDRLYALLTVYPPALEHSIDRLNDTSLSAAERGKVTEQCLAGIGQLSNAVKDQISYLPAHDQRVYSEALTGLSTRLQKAREANAPRQKFSFKARSKDPASKAPAANATANNAEDQRSEELREPSSVSTVAIKRNAQNALEVSNLTGTRFVLPSSASHTSSSGTLSQLKRCVVDISAPTALGQPYAGLTVKHIERSLIICGQVSGPIHITSLIGVTIVVGCRQFRMHESKDCDVYLHCASRPIIEGCSGMRFAPMPARFQLPQDQHTNNRWDHVDDFKWLKPEPSPNWAVLPEAERIQERVWIDIGRPEPDRDAEMILSAVGIDER